MTKRMRKKAAAEAKTETEKAAAEAKTETESVAEYLSTAKTETESVKAFRQRLRNERARRREEDKIKRITFTRRYRGSPSPVCSIEPWT